MLYFSDSITIGLFALIYLHLRLERCLLLWGTIYTQVELSIMPLLVHLFLHRSVCKVGVALLISTHGIGASVFVYEYEL